VLSLVLFAVLGADFSEPADQSAVIANGIVTLLLIWPSLAVAVKRCHDRNKSGFWVLISLIPILGWLWFLVEFGFLDGTQGPNRFGPSPKGIGADLGEVFT